MGSRQRANLLTPAGFLDRIRRARALPLALRRVSADSHVAQRSNLSGGQQICRCQRADPSSLVGRSESNAVTPNTAAEATNQTACEPRFRLRAAGYAANQ